MKKPLGRVMMVLLICGAGLSARAQVAGQPYQIPAGFESYPAGTLITYGGYNYVTQPDGTMLLAAQQPQQAVQLYTVPYNTTQYVYARPYVPLYTPGYYGGWYGGGYRGPGPWMGPRPGPWMGGPGFGVGPGFIPPGRMPGPFIGIR